MIIENDSHTVKELIEIGIPKKCAAILCKLSYNTLVFPTVKAEFPILHLSFY